MNTELPGRRNGRARTEWMDGVNIDKRLERKMASDRRRNVDEHCGDDGTGQRKRR